MASSSNPAPPYRVQRTPGFSTEQLLRALEDAEEKLGHRLDEEPRPHLCAAPLHANNFLARDRFSLDLDLADATSRAAAAAPGARHAALWLTASDLWSQRDAGLRAIEARVQVDPHCTLDVVLEARAPFPLDLLESIRAALGKAAPGYLTRSLAHRGEDAQRRIAVVVPASALLPGDWIDAVRDRVPLFVEQPLAQAARDAALLGAEVPAALITGPLDDARALERLLREADAASVAFADRAMESRWTREALGFGDADR